MPPYRFRLLMTYDSARGLELYYTTTPSFIDLWVKPAKFYAGIVGSKLSVNASTYIISLRYPGRRMRL